MPFAENNGVKIYWEAQGEGPPILLVMGLGWTSHMWYRTIPALSARYRTISFDNRGVGRSDVPTGPYSIPLMASDAAAVLDAAGVDHAHVFGVSMGGMIAQEFALAYPQRVCSLMLGCTAAGGPNAVTADAEVFRILTQRDSDPEVAARTMWPFIYDPATPIARLEEDLSLRRPWFPTAEGYFSQLQAIPGWEAYSRLPQIKAPTLVIHGESDRLVPSANAKLIADRIQGARLVTVPLASHILTTDQTEEVHRALLDFLCFQGSSRA